VATVTFAASKTKVPVGSPLDLTYTFVVSPDAKINGDYHVFVHLVNDEGQPVWFDDHDPLVPTSQWKPGQTVTYTRTEFLPVGPYVGKATMEIGLYKGDERLPLAGPDPTDKGKPARSYKVATLDLLPATENVFLIRKDGWYQAEVAGENASHEWQWTQKTATFDFKNPKKNVTLFFEWDARPDAFPAPQQVSIFSGTQLVTTFPADRSSATLRRIPISAAQLGDAAMVEIRIEVDKTFQPSKLPAGGKDNRELGIRVYHMFVDPEAEK
jgi:hypothetical protein